MKAFDRIALDIDDVLAGFFPHACEKFDKLETKCNIWDGVGVNKWIVDGFADITKDLDFWRTMPVISRANAIDFEVAAYITYSPLEVAEIRKEWLEKHGFPQAPLLNTQNKLKTMLENDINVIVEDRVSTVNAINNSGLGVVALQFKPPYMTVDCDNPDLIITHLSEVTQKLKDLKKL